MTCHVFGEIFLGISNDDLFSSILDIRKGDPYGSPLNSINNVFGLENTWYTW